MSTAIAVEKSIAVPPAASVRDIPLAHIQESKTNPRRQFDEAKLRELADNILVHGVLHPVLVRSLPEGGEHKYELVVGARRYRASHLAGMQAIPATIRELTDAQCMELQLIENLQRADVHELDEARAYATLMELHPDAYTVETLAAKVGRSQAYVYGRLRLISLTAEAELAFYSGKLTFAHAFEIARLQPGDQSRALRECFPDHRTAAAIVKDRKAEAATVRQLREWIEREIHLDLTNAPFDSGDEALLPSAGSCAKCPKRTGNNPLLFPEVRQKTTCTDRDCYRAKVEALVQIRVKPLVEGGQKPVRVSQTPSWQTDGRSPDVLHEGQYHPAKAKDECPSAKPAVLIDGRNAGTILYICQNEKCPVHARVTRYQPTPQERAKRSKELLAERVEKQARVRVLDAIRKKLPDTLSRLDLEMAALDYFRRLGHDNHRRLCRVYGWQEKKTRTSWGSRTVDFETIGRTAVGKMSNADLNRFLVVCALVSDLYCPGYNRTESLSKESSLARCAVRYKIDTDKLREAIRADLSKTASTSGKEPAKAMPRTKRN